MGPVDAFQRSNGNVSRRTYGINWVIRNILGLMDEQLLLIDQRRLQPPLSTTAAAQGRYDVREPQPVTTVLQWYGFGSC